MRTPKTDDELIRMFREAEYPIDICDGGTGPCVLDDGTIIDGEERVERAIRRDLGLPVARGYGWTSATIAGLRSPLDPVHRERLRRICEEGRRLGPLPRPEPTPYPYPWAAVRPDGFILFTCVSREKAQDSLDFSHKMYPESGYDQVQVKHVSEIPGWRPGPRYTVPEPPYGETGAAEAEADRR